VDASIIMHYNFRVKLRENFYDLKLTIILLLMYIKSKKGRRMPNPKQEKYDKKE
jgi:hypothetical protein